MNVSMITSHRSMLGRRILPWVSMAVSLVVVFLLFGAAHNVGAQGAQTKRSANDGVYTDEQAERGGKLYIGLAICSECHLRNLEADPQQKSKPLIGAGFISHFQTVDNLYTMIHTQEPRDNNMPGTLTPQQVSDLIAFILQRNGFPAGSQELGTNRAQLKLIKLEKPKNPPPAPPPYEEGTPSSPSY